MLQHGCDYIDLIKQPRLSKTHEPSAYIDGLGSLDSVMSCT